MAVPKEIVSFVSRSGQEMYAGGASNYIVQIPSGKLYSFFRNNADSGKIAFSTSIDGGINWAAPTTINAGDSQQISVWYDRWSGINGDLIHVAYTAYTAADTFYRNINTASSDSLSIEKTIFTGASTATGGSLSISRMRGGNLVCVGCIDAGTEVFSKKSTDVGDNWSDISAGYEASKDLCIVMPGWDADTNDAMMFYYDRSATEISVKYYDDSANSWSETSLSTSISLPDHATATLGHMSAAVDLTNSQNLLVFWTAVDSANADLRCFKVTQSTQTEVTNVVLNSTDDQGFCGIAIDLNNKWYVFYLGLSSGVDIYNTFLQLRCKTSSDDGVTWSSETSCFDYLKYIYICYVFINLPIIYTKWANMTMDLNSNGYLHFRTSFAIPRATYQLGI